jgi:PIN domain nuclease of toxin-antitoxin system
LRALLDTHTFLWWATDDPKLSPRAREFIRGHENALYFSVISVWEILLKARTGRLPIQGNVAEFVEVRIHRYTMTLLDLNLAHLTKFYALPVHHRDPSDQLLVAQAQVENLPLVTGDAQIKKYDLEVIW